MILLCIEVLLTVLYESLSVCISFSCSPPCSFSINTFSLFLASLNLLPLRLIPDVCHWLVYIGAYFRLGHANAEQALAMAYVFYLSWGIDTIWILRLNTNNHILIAFPYIRLSLKQCLPGSICIGIFFTFVIIHA